MSYFKKFPDQDKAQNSDSQPTKRYTNRSDNNSSNDSNNKYESKNYEKRKPTFKKNEYSSTPNAEPTEGTDAEFAKPKNSMTDSLISLDLDLMKLLVRRNNLLNKAQSRLKGQAFSTFEKEVRQAFETNAQKFSRDPKFTRQFFNLIQDLKVLQSANEVKEAYNLSPARKPVELSISAAPNNVLLSMYIILSTYNMNAFRLTNTLFTEQINNLIQALNLGGANLSLIKPSTLANAPENKLSFFDNSLFADDNLFNLFLLSFIISLNTGRCRINTGNQLKSVDLKALRNFLPQLGARLAHQIPGSSSAPIYIEGSALFEQTLSLNGELFDKIPEEAQEDYVFNFCAALFTALSASKLEHSITISNLNSFCQAGFDRAYALILPLLTSLNIKLTLIDNTLTLDATELDLSQPTTLNSDLNLSASFIALCLPHGGKVTLNNFYSANPIDEDNTFKFLKSLGIELNQTSNSLVATRKEGWQVKEFENFECLNFFNLNQEFKPLALALSTILSLKGIHSIKIDLDNESPEFKQITTDYLNLLNVEYQNGCLKRQEANAENNTQEAFVSPNPWWTLALAATSLQYLGQYKGQKSSLHLLNPKDIEQIYPMYWQLFNALPNPAMKKIALETTEDEPTKRRFIAN